MPTAGPTDRLHGTVPGGWEQWQDNGVLAVREPAEDRQSRHLAVGHGFTCYSGPPCPATRPWPQEALVNPVDGVGTARLPWFPLAWKHTAAWRHAPAKRTCKQWPCRRGPPAAPVGHMHAASDSSRDRPPDRQTDRPPPVSPCPRNLLASLQESARNSVSRTMGIPIGVRARKRRFPFCIRLRWKQRRRPVCMNSYCCIFVFWANAKPKDYTPTEKDSPD